MRILPLWQSLLLWFTLGVAALLLHTLVTGDSLDDSSYTAGLIVAFVGLCVTNYYGD